MTRFGRPVYHLTQGGFCYASWGENAYFRRKMLIIQYNVGIVDKYKDVFLYKTTERFLRFGVAELEKRCIMVDVQLLR